jgi:hypothetical protein
MLRQYRKRKAIELDAFDSDVADDGDISFGVLIDLESQLRREILKRYESSNDETEVFFSDFFADIDYDVDDALLSFIVICGNDLWRVE